MSKTIITVDDSATLRKMVSMTLKGAGYNVLEAEDGQVAFRLLSAQRADMVITDLNMPNMDGITLTRELRGLPNYARTPIILLTTETEPGKKVAGKEAGATGWIVKPFSQEQLLAIVAKVLPA